MFTQAVKPLAAAIALALCLIPCLYAAAGAEQIKIPVLLYHAVSETAGENPELYVKTSEFERQMRYLQESGYTPVRFAKPEAYAGIKKPVIITFDDGYEDNRTNAYPVLLKYGFTATVFLVSSTVGTPRHLNAAQIAEMSPLIEFGCHTATHRDLAELNLPSIIRELVLSRAELKKVTGAPVRLFSYPYGSIDARATAAARILFEFAVTTDRGYYTSESDRALVSRIYITRSDTVKSFAAKLTGA